MLIEPETSMSSASERRLSRLELTRIDRDVARRSLARINAIIESDTEEGRGLRLAFIRSHAAGKLTPRQRKILNAAAHRKGSQVIAEELGTAVERIKAMKQKLMADFRFEKWSDLVRYAVSEGLTKTKKKTPTRGR